MTEYKNSTHPKDETTRRAILVAKNIGANNLLFLVLGIYLTITTTGSWQAIGVILLALEAVIGGFVAASMFKRGQVKQAIWVLLITNCIAPASAAWIIASFSLVSVAYIAVSTYFIYSFATPMEQRRSALTTILIALVIASVSWFVQGAWMLVSPAMLTVAPIFVTILSLALIVIIVRQSWDAVNNNLRLKLTVWAGIVLTVSTIVLVSYSVITSRQKAIETAQDDALQHAETEAGYIRAEAEIPMDTARALAHSLTAVKNPDANVSLSRDDVNAMLRQVLIENPSFLGVDTLWEPNAFDGLDAQFVGADAHDETGRFIPYWTRRADGSIAVEALLAYETPGDGDWYLQPRSTKTEYTFAPLVYPVNGVDTTMATFTAPIVVDGTFYGIIGVDAPITFVQELVDGFDLYNGTADAVLMSASGTLIGVTNHPELVTQPATEFYPDFSDLQARLEAGESFSSPSPDGQYLRVFAPVDIGRTGTHWVFSLTIPYTQITAEATRAALTQVGISLALIILALYLLWYLNGQVVNPLISLTGVANSVTEGDFGSRAEIISSDEVGTLATAFNTMTSRLQETLQGMEQRVADRTRNLEVAAKVGRTVSQVSKLDVMLKEASELILKEFDLYYVQVYLTDPSQRNLVLEAGTGDVGEQLLARGHKLNLDTGSLNGRAAAEKRSVVISNTAQSPTFRKNPLLPETRAEMAVPLIIGDRVVGVLDMQSSEPGALNEEVLPAFEALAGQMAVAVQNAKLLAETEQARAEVEKQAGRLVRKGWNEHLDAIHKPENIGYVFDHNQVTALAEVDEAQLPDEGLAIMASISVTGESLGSLSVEISDESQREQTNELVAVVARQVAQQIENLRLLESADRYRQESETAARRLTIDAWKDYVQSRPQSLMGYMYDSNEVKALNALPDDDSVTLLPIQVGGETIGRVSVQDLKVQDDQSLDIAKAIIERLGAHIENLRLLQKTEETRAEVQQSQERLSEALNIAKLGNWEYNVEKDIFTFNDNFYAVFHTNIKEVGSYTMSSAEYAQRFVHPEDTPLVGSEIERTLKSTERYFTTSVEHRIFFPDGSLGYVTVSVHVERDEEGNITRFYGANQDITERKQAEEELRARETQLSEALAESQTLYRVNEAISDKTDLDVIYQTVAQLSCEEMNFSGAWVAVYEPENSAIRGAAGINMPEERIFGSLSINDATPASLAAKTRQVVTVNNPQQDERMVDIPPEILAVMGKALSVPIMVGQELLGVIAVTRPESGADISVREERILQSIAVQLAIVMQRVTLFEQIQKQAQHESMLNTINQKIQSATSVEAVLQIAARELGHALGAPMAVAQLSMKDKS